MEKTDIHSHILPGLDDGSRDMEESLELLKAAYGQGFTRFIATPHYAPGFRNDCPQRIRELCGTLQEKARKLISPSLYIYAGQEIYWENGVMEKLDRGELLTLAGSAYVLTEFAPHAPYSLLYKSLRDLRLAGYIPVLAHAERYAALREDERAEEIVEAGALIQLNYESIGGSVFNRISSWCRRRLESGTAHFLGTDMHRMDMRPPAAEKAMKWMQKHLEQNVTEALCRENAGKILADKSI